MTTAPHPDVLIRPGSHVGLVMTIAVSAFLHVAAIAVLVSLPRRFLGAAPPLASYTVDLVAPDSIGGTNLQPGSGGRRAPAPPVPRPPAPKGSEPAREGVPAAVVEPRPPVPKPRAVEVAKRPEPDVPKAVEEPPQPAKVKAAIEPQPKPAPEPPKPAAAKAESAKPAPDKSQAKPAPAPEPRPVAKAAAPPPVEAPAAKAEVAAKPAAKPKPAEQKPAVPVAKTAPEQSADTRIAKAVAERARQVESKATDSSARSGEDLDGRIAAAVRRRVVQQMGAGGTAGRGTGDGGPISSGPGVGAGGTVMSLEYIAYRSQMEARIKEAWAWAGANRSLVAVIAFNITPDGEIINVRTVGPSGDSSYDASAERAVRRASPLGPPPEKYREEFWSVELEFRPEDARS
jgi:colicin import membrane protein